MLEMLFALRHPKAFLISLLGGGLMLLGVTYTMFAYQAEGESTFTEIVGTMAEMLNLPSIPGIYENPGRAALAAEGGMADALPPARDGWTRRGWEAADGKLLIDASRGLAADRQWLGASVVDEFLEVARGEMPGVLQTYARGAERIVVMIRRLPTAYSGAGELSLAEHEAATQKMLASGLAPLAVHGIALHGFGVPVAGQTPPFERLEGSVASQISIEVATNSDRQALVGLLSGLDMAALDRFADVPDPIVSADKGVQVAPGLTAGIAAPIAPQPEVTRGVAPAQAPVAAEPEKQPTGVCVRRAGVRVCE